MLKLFLLFHFVRNVFAVGFTFNHFINPPADPQVDPKTKNNVVSFTQGTTEKLRWVTTFKLSSVALLPLGANPLESKSTAAFITRNFTRTAQAMGWAVAPPPGMQPGVYFLHLYEEGGSGNFPSHIFTINVNASASSTSETPATPMASQTSRSTAILSTSPTIVPLSSTMASTETTTATAITSSNASASFSFFPPSSAAAPSVNDPAIAATSSPPSATSLSSSSVPASTTSSATVKGPSSIPASTTSPESQSSSSSTTSTFNTMPGSTALGDTQRMMMTEKFTTSEKLAAILVPILVVVVAAFAYLAYRHLTRRRGVEAMMAKSLRVKEMPAGDAMSSRWRDTVGNEYDHSLQPWRHDRWRKLMWWKRS